MNILKPLRPRKTKDSPPENVTLYLRSEHAHCTCPESCERDHGNE
jgi:hypothetical protein